MLVWRFKQPNLSPLILERFLGIHGVAFQFNRSLDFHLVRWRVKVQQILSTRSWGSKPSLLSGFITIVGEVHIKRNGTIIFIFSLSHPSRLNFGMKWIHNGIFKYFQFFCNFLLRVWLERNETIIFIFHLSHPFPTYFGLKWTIIVFLLFFEFFYIFMEFSITLRVGTKRNDNFYFLPFPTFSNLFWLIMKPHWYFLIFWIF